MRIARSPEFAPEPWDRTIFPVLQPGADTPEPRLSDTGGDLPGDDLMAMSGKATRKGALLNSGTLSPNPWDLTLLGQNVWPKLEGTRTQDQPPQGCALSAASSAGWQVRL